jgi:DNA-directed RNA polymerase subunit RPC12/RpoP
MREEVLVIERGEEVVCPKCKTVIGEFKKEKAIGEVIGVEDIQFYVGDFKKGDKMLCPRCGFPWGVSMMVATSMGLFLTHSVHTRRGWVPPKVPTEELAREVERLLRSPRPSRRGSAEEQRP